MDEARSQDRWLAALCYVSLLVLIPILFVKIKSEWLARHCRQGFALLFAEIVAWLLLIAVDATIGLIPILGLLLSVLLHLAVFLVFLILSVIGCVKALSGEDWRLPVLDDFAERVPIHGQS